MVREYEKGQTLYCVNAWIRSRSALSSVCIALDCAFLSAGASSMNLSIQIVSPNLTYACDLYGCSVSLLNWTLYNDIWALVGIPVRWRNIPAIESVVWEATRLTTPPFLPSSLQIQPYRQSSRSGNHTNQSFLPTRSQEDGKRNLRVRARRTSTCSRHLPERSVFVGFSRRIICEIDFEHQHKESFRND